MVMKFSGVVRFALALCLVAAMSGGGAIGPAWGQPAGGKRIALVIGNGSYRSVDRLANPANDARLIASTLQSSGFTLVGGGAQLDLEKTRFDRAIQAFGQALAGADVALFYYSGHGMQVQGENWLVPVDANPTGTRDLDFQMVDANLVLRQMENAGTKLNLLILDACRNNPFASRGVRGSQGGLAEMRAPEGTLISYATQPGNVASDGVSQNSPYTAALAAAMRRPGLDVFQVFNQVGLSVKQVTAGGQQPWLASSPISGSFYFFAGPVTIAPPAAPDGDALFWQGIASSRDAGDFQAYLRRFPEGTFAELARRRIKALSVVARPEPATRSNRPDGTWNIDLGCEAKGDDVRGWSRRIKGTVDNGVMHAEAGTRGQPEWLSMDGLIEPDGHALLTVRGLRGNPESDLYHRPSGTAYKYMIEGRFTDTRGAASRMTERQCTATFVRE